MIKIDFQLDIDRALQKLADIQKQAEFATAVALTQTAKDAQDRLAEEVDSVFDRPTPFTKKAFGTRAATKQKLESAVFIRPKQFEYLRYQIFGGDRSPAGRAIPVPVGIDLNQYGNIPRGKLSRLLSQPGVFSGVVKGIGGIWQRKKNGHVVLLVSWKSKAKYQARFKFYETAKAAAIEAFPRRFSVALDRALATARR